MVSPVEPAPHTEALLPPDWEQQIVRAYTIFNTAIPAVEPEQPEPVLASATKWMEKLHPRNADGEFIDVRARLKPAKQQVSKSMSSMFTSWQSSWESFGKNFQYAPGAPFNPFEVKVNAIFGWLRHGYGVRPVLDAKRVGARQVPPELAKQPVNDPPPTSPRKGWKPDADEYEYLNNSPDWTRTPGEASPPKKGRVHTNSTKYRRKDGYTIEHHYDPEHYEGDGRWRVIDPEGNEIDYQRQRIEEVEALIESHKEWKAAQDTKRQERAARKRAKKKEKERAEGEARQPKKWAWIDENRTSTDPLNRQIADILENPENYTEEQVWEAKNAWDAEHSSELYDPTAMTEAYLEDFLKDNPEAEESPDELAVLYEEVYQQMLVVSDQLNQAAQGVIDVGDWLLEEWDKKMNPVPEEVLPEGVVRDQETGLLIDTVTGQVVDEGDADDDDDDDEDEEPEEEWVPPPATPAAPAQPPQPGPAQPPSAPATPAGPKAWDMAAAPEELSREDDYIPGIKPSEEMQQDEADRRDDVFDQADKWRERQAEVARLRAEEADLKRRVQNPEYDKPRRADSVDDQSYGLELDAWVQRVAGRERALADTKKKVWGAVGRAAQARKAFRKSLNDLADQQGVPADERWWNPGENEAVIPVPDRDAEEAAWAAEDAGEPVDEEPDEEPVEEPVGEAPAAEPVEPVPSDELAAYLGGVTIDADNYMDIPVSEDDPYRQQAEDAFADYYNAVQDGEETAEVKAAFYDAMDALADSQGLPPEARWWRTGAPPPASSSTPPAAATPTPAPTPEPAAQPTSSLPLMNVEVRGDVTPQMQEHLDDLATVPTHIAEKVAGHGIRPIVHSGPVSDVRTHLKGVTPRGWPADKTWDDVPGSFARKDKIVVLGELPGGGGHGSASLALHEYGHAVDLAFGVVSKSPEFREVWDQIGWTNSYYSQKPDAGAEEAFAELFSLMNYTDLERQEFFEVLGRTVADAQLIAQLYAVMMRMLDNE